MHLLLLALLLLGVGAQEVRGQDAATYFWSTSVTYRLSDTDLHSAEVSHEVDEAAADESSVGREAQAAASPTGVELAQPDEAPGAPGEQVTDPLRLERFADLPPGGFLSVDVYEGIRERLDAAGIGEIGLIGEVDGATAAVEPVAEAVLGGIAGLIVRGREVDVTDFRLRLEKALGMRIPVAAEHQGTNADAVVADPPLAPTTNAPDWERIFAGAARNVVTRVRVDAWPSHLLHGLALLPGGLYLDGRGDATVSKIIAFRLRHPAVGAGVHERLVNSVYSFHRSLRRGPLEDDVVVVLNASGTTALNVSRAFEDDIVVRDAMTGQTAFVSFGRVAFDADPSGIILIEEVR